MTEREWDINGAIQRLQTKPEAINDLLCGEGIALEVPGIGGRLELFPDRLVVRYRSASLHIDLGRVRLVTTDRQGVHLRTADSHVPASLFISAKGGLSLSITKGTPAPASESTPDQPAPRTPRPEPAPESAKAPEAAEAVEPPQRLTLTGRVGREPSARTTPSGRYVVRAPLAVHAGEATEWHRLIFFNSLAKKAAETLHKGDLVTVVGYPHVRETVTKDGIPKQATEVYVAGLQTPKAKE